MGYIAMKRGIEEVDSITTMANCLIFLSRGGGGAGDHFNTMINDSESRVFECKTCNRQFSSFQALGGHRASHKKPRIMGGDLNLNTQLQTSSAKPKTHECSVCGLEFAIGQALGGHMRRHRAGLNENRPSLSLSPKQVSVVKTSNSRRILCVDLNLTPLENDLEFQLEKVSPLVNCYL